MAVIFGPSLWQNQAYEIEAVQYASLGDEVTNGGYLICRNGGTAWVVAPASSEVSRTWHCREDAVTTATACTNATGWFVPTIGQLQNPGYPCRTYWDSYSSTRYWSSTEVNISQAWRLDFSDGSAAGPIKSGTYCVRALRCIAY